MESQNDKFELEKLSNQFIEVLKMVEVTNNHIEAATQEKKTDELASWKKQKKEQVDKLLGILSKFDVELEINEAA